MTTSGPYDAPGTSSATRPVTGNSGPYDAPGTSTYQACNWHTSTPPGL